MGLSSGLIGGIGSAVGGLISGAIGLHQQHKAHKLLNSLQFPTEQMPQEVLQNQAIAQQMANQGLPSEQYTKAMRDIQRQQMTAIRGANDRRGGLGLISQIQQGTDDATTNLNAQDAMMRNQNKKYLVGVNSDVANWKSKLFNNNQRAKYNQDYGYGMNLLGAGNQNFSNGLDALVGGGMLAANASNSKNQMSAIGGYM